MWAFKANISANETGSTFTLQVVLQPLYIYMHVANSLHWGKHFALMYIWFTMLHSVLIIIYPWNMNITSNNNVSNHKNEFLEMLLGIRPICNFLVDWNVPHKSHYLFNGKKLTLRTWHTGAILCVCTTSQNITAVTRWKCLTNFIRTDSITAVLVAREWFWSRDWGRQDEWIRL